jgi:hypothetical protein
MHHAARSLNQTGARQKRPSQQAVIERICDEKSGERRGDQRKTTTEPVACFRKIFAAQIPPSPQRDQGRLETFKAQEETRPSKSRHLEMLELQQHQGRTDILKSPRSHMTLLKRTVLDQVSGALSYAAAPVSAYGRILLLYAATLSAPLT